MKGAHWGPDQKTAQLHQQHGEKALSLIKEKHLDRHTWDFFCQLAYYTEYLYSHMTFFALGIQSGIKPFR